MNNKDMPRRTTETLPALPAAGGVGGGGEANAHRFVFLRHGESEFNNASIFTGWCDVALTQRGVVESVEAGQVFASHGLTFSKCYCSLLTRSIVTAHRALEAAGIAYTPLAYDWRLNERHYGALQGLSKERTAQRLGRELVMRWRRSYEARPPNMLPDHPHYDMINNDPRYEHLADNIPQAESLEDCQVRVVEAWKDILKDTRQCVRSLSSDNNNKRNNERNNNNNNKKEVQSVGSSSSGAVTTTTTTTTTSLKSSYSLVVAHANTLRALVMHLDDISPHEIEGLNIPTAIPFYYDLHLETGNVLSGQQDHGDAAAVLDRIGLGRFRGIYIADERKKMGFLERRRAANDPFRWALYDHQVDRNMLLKDTSTTTTQASSSSLSSTTEQQINVEEQMEELEKEAGENTKLFSPNLQKQESMI